MVAEWNKSGLTKARQSGLFIVLLVFGFFGLWSVSVPLAQAVVSSGTVKVLSSRKQVQHQEGGIIQSIQVKDGAIVQAGDILVRLDPTRAQNAYELLKKRYKTAFITLQRLKAELSGKEHLDVDFEALSKVIEVHSVELNEIIASQNALLQTRLQTRASGTVILKEKIAQLEQDKIGLEAQMQARGEQISSIEKELKGLRPLLAKGFASRTRISALERDLSDLVGQRATMAAEKASLLRSVAEAEEEISRSSSNFYERAHEEYQQKQSELQDVLEQMQTAQYSLRQSDVRAPATGKIVGLSVHTAGGVINAGDVLMEIVPADDALIVEARITPQDVDVVALGQPVDLQLHTHAAKDAAKLTGELSYVSADSMIDERTGAGYFIARVKLSEEAQTQADALNMKPGVSADVYIKTGTRTAFAYLIEPLKRSMAKAWREQ